VSAELYLENCFRCHPRSGVGSALRLRKYSHLASCYVHFW